MKERAWKNERLFRALHTWLTKTVRHVASTMIFRRRLAKYCALCLCALHGACLAPAGQAEHLRNWEWSPDDAAVSPDGVLLHGAADREWQPYSIRTDLRKLQGDQATDYFWLRTHVPATGKTRTLLIMDAFDLLEVFVDGRRAYTYAVHYAQAPDIRKQRSIPIIELPAQPVGIYYLVELRMFGGHDHFHGLARVPLAGPRDVLILRYLVHDLDHLLLGFLFFLLAVSTAVIAVFARPTGLLLSFSLLNAVTMLHVLVFADVTWISAPLTDMHMVTAQLKMPFLLPVAMALFGEFLFSDDAAVSRLFRWSWIIQAITALVIFTMTLPIAWYPVLYVHMLMHALLYVVAAARRALRRYAADDTNAVIEGRILLAGIVCMILAAANDILEASGFRQTNVFVFRYGLLALIGAVSVLLIRRFFAAQDNLRRYAAELEHTNRSIERKIRERTTELSAALAQINKDLEVARTIQQRILPRHDEEFAPARGIDYHFEYLPVDQVGGDFIDLAEIRPGLIRLMLADAVGHGVQASLYTMALKSGYEEVKQRCENPADALVELNSRIRRDFLELKAFLPCFIADLDVRGRTLTYASAGHPEQLLITRPAGGPGGHAWLERTGPILGLTADPEIANRRLELTEHSTLYLFSDGLTESTNAAGEFFGQERILEIARIAGGPRQAVAGLLQSERAFRSSAPRHDDMTVLVLHV